MPRLTCEVCGGHDIIKQEGVFLCQGCGCKYSLEEVRGMLDGAAEAAAAPIAGDAENRLADLRAQARQAREDNSNDTACRYYEQILQETPNDWEAAFYATFCAAHNVKVAQIGEAANRVSHCFDSVMKLMKASVPVESTRRQHCVEITTAVFNFESMLIDNVTKNLSSDAARRLQQVDEWAVPAISMLIHLGDSILKVMDDTELPRLLFTKAMEHAGGVKVSAAARSLEAAARKRIDACQRRTQSPAPQAKPQEHPNDQTAHQQTASAALRAEDSRLENEQQELRERLNQLKKKKSNVPAMAEYTAMMRSIKTLTEELDTLSLFKGARKKELRGQIEELDAKRREQWKLCEAQQKAVEDRMRLMEGRITEIENRRKEIGQALSHT